MNLNESNDMTRTSCTLGEKVMELLMSDKGQATKPRRIGNSPGVRLPNTSSFKIIVNVYDPLLQIFDVNKRRDPALEFEAYRNKNMNKYLEHMVTRLDNARDNPKLYGTIAEILLRRSNTFRVAAINHVFRNGYKNYPLGFILNVNRKVSKLINQKISVMEYTRVYIEKGDTFRPLGVPAPEGRVLLHMYSNFLTFFLYKDLPHQHAYIPGKGTLTAGTELFKSGLLNKRFIHEGDFKKFFDSINNTAISDILYRKGVPHNVVTFLQYVNQSPIKLPKVHKLDESFVLNKAGQGAGAFGMRPSVMTNDRVVRMGQQGLIGHDKETSKGGRLRKYNPCAPKFFEFENPIQTGVAQGAPTSPILANVIMNEGIAANKRGGQDCIAYADDSISFSDKAIGQPLNNGVLGMNVNNEKSRYVKENGKGVHPLKFLGLTFDGKTLTASTRKGSKLTLDEKYKSMITLYDIREDNKLTAEEKLKKLNEALIKLGEHELEFDNYKTNKSSGSKYFSSKLIGFIQSRLYAGTGNLENIEQDFNLTFVNNSGMSTKLVQGAPTLFTASSLACGSLNNILRWNSKMRRPRKNKTIIVRRIPN